MRRALTIIPPSLRIIGLLAVVVVIPISIAVFGVQQLPALAKAYGGTAWKGPVFWGWVVLFYAAFIYVTFDYATKLGSALTEWRRALDGAVQGAPWLLTVKWVVFLVSVAGLLAAAVILARSDQAIVAAAVIGALPIATVFAYERWLDRPILSIEFDSSDGYQNGSEVQLGDSRPITVPWNNTVADHEKIMRRFVRVLVRNDGQKAATNCQATLRVTHRPAIGSESCRAPSGEPKSLVWSESELVPDPRGSEERGIYGFGGSAYLDVIFSHAVVWYRWDGSTEVELTTQPITPSFGASDRWGPLVAFVASRQAQINMAWRAQDGLCRGVTNEVRDEYAIEIVVRSAEGARTRAEFLVRLGHDWRGISIA